MLEFVSLQILQEQFKRISGEPRFLLLKTLVVMASSHEVFELASSYQSTSFRNNEKPTLTRDQARELYSVELTQNKFRSIYKSPYGNQGHSDEENTDSDEDVGTGAAAANWSNTLIEDY